MQVTINFYVINILFIYNFHYNYFHFKVPMHSVFNLRPVQATNLFYGTGLTVGEQNQSLRNVIDV